LGLLRWFALVWASAGYVALLWLPAYSQARDTISPAGVHTITRGRTTLGAVNGPKVYRILAVPVIAALLPVLPWPRRFRRGSLIVGAVLETAFVALGLASVGLFFFPSALALGVAAILARNPNEVPPNER
jgi:hypothetical protein